MAKIEVFCPVHNFNVTKNGYDIGEGWKRCEVDVDEPRKGECLFSTDQ